MFDMPKVLKGVQVAQIGYTRPFSKGNLNSTWAFVVVAVDDPTPHATKAVDYVESVLQAVLKQGYLQADFTMPASSTHAAFKFKAEMHGNRLALERAFVQK